MPPRPRMPSIFVSHGPPSILFMDHPARRFLAGLGRELPRPVAVLCISAHFEAVRPLATGAPEPDTIFDFSGPRKLFENRYPAKGDPELAETASALLREAGMDAGVEPSRGMDHGAWVPLRLMYPDADIPVVSLSVQTEKDARFHLDMGRALVPLRSRGVLILGSGGAVHNLGRIYGASLNDPPQDFARQFDDWLCDAVSNGNENALADWRSCAPEPDESHPWPAEHFLPLFPPLGAAGPGAKGRVLHRSFMYASLSMAAFRWD